MFHRYASLIGGPLDGGCELLEQDTDELLVEHDFIEALAGSYYFYIHPVNDFNHHCFERRLEQQRQADPNRGWQVLLYRQREDGRFYFVRKLNGLAP
jgi:hypothetical protein